MADIHISKANWDKIINYAKGAYKEFGAEIGGMSVCYKDKDDNWVVTDPIILKQEVTMGTCSLDKTELAKYYTKAGTKWKNHDFRFCWWHSHHTMNAFWSDTDKKAIDEYSDGDMSFALVVNLKEEYKFRISIWKPFEMHEDVEIYIDGLHDDLKVPKKIIDEVKELCNKPKIQSNYLTKNGYYNGSQQTMFHNATNLCTITDDMDPTVIANLPEDFDPQDKTYDHMIEKNNDWLQKLCDGNVSHKDYIKEVNKENLTLDKQDSNFRYLPLPHTTSEHLYYQVWPEEYIAVKQQSGEFIQMKSDIDNGGWV